MSNCCAPSIHEPASPRKQRCPCCGAECAEVSLQTILHHIRNPWQWQGGAQRHFFCDGPACEVVYFGEDGAMIGKAQLRTVVGIKERAPQALLCYCFGVTRAQAECEPQTRAFVVQQTRAGGCSCTTSNPSGRCCLREFPAGNGREKG